MIPSAEERTLFSCLYDMLSKADQMEGILKNSRGFWSNVMAMDYAETLLLELSENLLKSASSIAKVAASTLKRVDEQ